ncbi:MAG: SpoIIE family protein phosphatase [bacterium]
MSNNDFNSGDFAELREKAQKILNNIESERLENLEEITKNEISQLFHQLQVHQLELELQNEELREAKSELEKARASYYKLFDLAPVGYCTLSKKGIIKEANLAAANYLGRSRAEVIQKEFTQYILPEDQDIYYNFRKKLFDSFNFQECELRMQKGEDKIFWARLKGEIIQRGKENLSFLLTMEDITERKEKEKELRVNKNLLQSLANKTPGAVYQYQIFPDGSSCFPYATEDIYEIYEVTPQEIKEDASKVFARIHEEDYERVAVSIKKSAESLTVWEEEYRVRLPEKGIRWVEGYAEPEKKADGSVLWHGNIRDITMRKERERKLQEQKEEIEKMNNKLNKNIEKGRTMHKQFLPDHLPEVNNLSLSTYYTPADRLGGDFYDVIEFEDELLFYVSDVSGHDLSSAMLNIFLKETINSYLFHTQQTLKKEGLSSSSIIQHVSERFQEEGFTADYFICLVIGTIDKRSFEVSLSNAGVHFPPLINQKDGGIFSFSCSGMPVSVINENFVYENCSYKLQTGDTLIINTDGLFEQTDCNDNMYGEERLLKILPSNSGLKPDKLVNKIYEDFYEFKGNMILQDDLTSLLIQRKYN